MRKDRRTPGGIIRADFQLPDIGARHSNMGDWIKITRLAVATCAIGSLAACGEEPPPTSVIEFMENPVLLDATMVRCVQDRETKKYDAECVNAREAAGRIAVAAEEARREELEAQSERKRLALRRAQEAADAARRRADELKRLREEAEYLGLVEVYPADDAGLDGASPEALTSDSPVENEAAASVTVSDLVLPKEKNMPANPPASMPAAGAPQSRVEGAAAPIDVEGEPVDLEAVREELQQRDGNAPQTPID